MTQEQIIANIKQAQVDAQAGNLKAQLQAWVADGGIIDQQKQLELEQDPSQSDLIVAHYNKQKQFLQTVIASL